MKLAKDGIKKYGKNVVDILLFFKYFSLKLGGTIINALLYKV